MQSPAKRLVARNAAWSTRPCRHCRLSKQRPFTTSAVRASETTPSSSSSPPPPKPPASGLVSLRSRQLLAVGGVDAPKFLQGLVSSSVTAKDGHPRRDAFYTGFLNATGRVMHDVFIYPDRQTQDDTPGYYIEVDATQADRLAKYIKRHKLRAKVSVRKLDPDQANVWCAWDRTEALDTSAATEASATVILDPRAPGLGYRVLQLDADRPSLPIENATEDDYTIRRYLHGVAEGQEEILREQSLPLESNMELMSGIDFHKGCYVGQELTIRTKHRGVVRKRILPVVVYAEDKAPPTELSYDPDGVANVTTPGGSVGAGVIPCETSIGRVAKKGRSTGKWLRGVGNIGLGLCRLEMMTDLTLPGEQASATFHADDEFAMVIGQEDQQKVKVKAFVPDWIRRGLAATDR